MSSRPFNDASRTNSLVSGSLGARSAQTSANQSMRSTPAPTGGASGPSQSRPSTSAMPSGAARSLGGAPSVGASASASRAPSSASPIRATPGGTVGGGIKTGPAPQTATNIAFLCHYTVAEAVVSDKVVSVTREAPNATPKAMTRTSVSRLSPSVLSLIAVPSTMTMATAGGGQRTFSTLFPTSDASAASRTPSSTQQQPTRPLPTGTNGGSYLPSAPHSLVQEIITAFNSGIRSKVPTLTQSQMPTVVGSATQTNNNKADGQDDEAAPVDRTGLNIASSDASVYSSQQGFVGLVLREASTKGPLPTVLSVFNLSRLLDVQLFAGEGTVASASNGGGGATPTQSRSLLPPGGDFKLPSPAEEEQSAEAALGRFQTVLDNAVAAKGPIKVNLVFAHHSEPLRDLKATSAASSVKSLTSLLLTLSPFPAGANGALLMLTEENEGVKSVCGTPASLTDPNLYASALSNTGLAPPKRNGGSGGGARRFLLFGQQQQPVTFLDSSENVERVCNALQKSLGKVSTGESSALSDQAEEGGHKKTATTTLMPATFRSQGPLGILTPPLVDALLFATSTSLRTRLGIGPMPPISASDGKESSTTTTSNHIAEAIKKMVLYEPSTTTEKESSGSVWPLLAFLQHLVIVLDTHRPPNYYYGRTTMTTSTSTGGGNDGDAPSPNANSAPANASRTIVMNPYVGQTIESRLRPLFSVLGGIAVELINAENERRAIEAKRQALIAEAGVEAQRSELDRLALLEKEDSHRREVESAERKAFDAIRAESEESKRMIIAKFLELERVREAEREREQERLRIVGQRFAKVFARLADDETHFRIDYAKMEVSDLRRLFALHQQGRMLIMQLEERNALRKAERPERVHLWAKEKRERSVLHHAIRAAQMSIYADARRREHEAEHKIAYLEQVKFVGEIGTLTERLRQMEYIRARLEEEVIEKEAKVLKRPHADALAQIIESIVDRHGPFTQLNVPNARLYPYTNASIPSLHQPPAMHQPAVDVYGAHYRHTASSDYDGQTMSMYSPKEGVGGKLKQPHPSSPYLDSSPPRRTSETEVRPNHHHGVSEIFPDPLNASPILAEKSSSSQGGRAAHSKNEDGSLFVPTLRSFVDPEGRDSLSPFMNREHEEQAISAADDDIL